MPKVNGTKHSKSELIHMLLDKRTRTEVLPAVLESNGIRLPKTVLFGEDYDPELCKRDLLANRYKGFYSYFSLRKSPEVGDDFPVLIRALMSETNRRLFRLLGSPEFPKVPEALIVENDAERIFYLSLLLIQNRCPKTEHSLLSLLYKLFGGTFSRESLKYCKTKFSKDVVGEFIRSNVCEIRRCYRFLSSIAHKLPENLAELWFENDFDPCDGVFSRLNSIRVSEDICFNRFAFYSLVKFKSFRKAVFNNPLNDEFVISMREYANRPDFNYFYKTRGAERCLKSLPIRPKDAVEYDFFGTSSSEKLPHSDIIKIRNYQIKHGHTPVLNSFVSERLPRLLESVEKESLAEDIIADTIEYNSSSSASTAISINDTIFEVLRKKEDVFRRIVGCFKNPKDRVLSGLIAGNFDFGIECARPYINLGYEEELMEYFKSQRTSDCLSIVDSWNREFFAKTFIRKAPYSLSDAKLLLDFSCANYDLELVSEVLSHVLDVDSDEIFRRLPENLRVIYLLRHRAYVREFVDSVDPESCTLEQASQIFEVLDSRHKHDLGLSGGEALPTHSLHYSCAVRDDFEFDESHLAESLFECCYVRRDEAKYLFVKYFDRFIEDIVQNHSKDEIVAYSSQVHDFDRFFHFRTCGRDRIAQSLRSSPDFNGMSQVLFVLELGLGNKHSTFILFDKIISMLSEGSSSHRILILGFVNPSTLCKAHVLRYINALIPLLDNSNSAVCRLSRTSLNMIRVETREVQNILPQIIQSLISREHFPVFLTSLRSILFSNYLCFNSLNILVQLMFKYLDDYTKDALFVLSKIVNIIKDKDMKHISGLIFSNISKFVVSHNFYTKEALEVSGQFCMHTKFSDFGTLLQNIASMRICSYLVGVLKIRNDTKLNSQIISHILCNRNGASAVEPSFVAAVSELEEFTQYLDEFLPILKTLFKDNKVETRNIAAKAFRHILERPGVDDYASEINSFLLDCSINEDYSVRLLCLDVLDHLPIIYVLRNDQHSLVRKKAQDMWKDRISNTNRVLRDLHGAILDLIEFSSNKTFCFALRGTVKDMATKYTSYLELYVRNNGGRADINEFILVEALKINKMPDTALEFCKSNFSVDVFKSLYKMPDFRDRAVSSLGTADLVKACHGDCELALGLYNSSRNPVYLGFLSTSQRIEIIRSHYQSSGFVSEGDEDMIFVLRSLESCSRAESILVRIHPTYSYHYLLTSRIDHGSLNKIFERVFENCHNIDRLVSERNIGYIRDCLVDRVQNKTRLLALFLHHEDKKSFEKVVHLIRESDFAEAFEQDIVFEIMGYLLRSYLSINRRADSYDCIVVMYGKYRESMGFFRQIVQASVLDH